MHLPGLLQVGAYASAIFDAFQLDSAHGLEFTYADAQLAKYREHMGRMHAHTLGVRESRDFIHNIARQL